MKNQTYQKHQTLWQCFDKFKTELENSQYSSPEFDTYLHTGGIAYGQKWQRSFELITAKGNKAQKCFHAFVERGNDGLYSVNFYTL